MKSYIIPFLILSAATFSFAQTEKQYKPNHNHPDGVAIAADHWHGTQGYKHGHAAAATDGASGWAKLVEWQLPYDPGLEHTDYRAWRTGGTFASGHARKDLPMADLHPWEQVAAAPVEYVAPPPAPAPQVEQPMCRGRGNWR